MSDAPVLVGPNIFRIEADGLAEIRQGAIVLALDLVPIAPVVVGESVLGIEPDRLVVIGDRAIEVALGFVGDGPVVVGVGVFGIKADRLVVIGDRAVEIPFGFVGYGTVDVGADAIPGGLPPVLKDTRTAGDATVRIFARAILPLALSGTRATR